MKASSEVEDDWRLVVAAPSRDRYDWKPQSNRQDAQQAEQANVKKTSLPKRLSETAVPEAHFANSFERRFCISLSVATECHISSCVLTYCSHADAPAVLPKTLRRGVGSLFVKSIGKASLQLEQAKLKPGFGLLRSRKGQGQAKA